MRRRLTLLTPLAYFTARLRSAFYQHRIGFMLLSLSLVVAAGVLLWPASRSSQAASGLPPVPADRFIAPREFQPTTALDATDPSATPTVPPVLTPTALPIPQIGLVWGGNASGAYLWQAPQGKILVRLTNGTKVQLLEERVSYGNLPWIKVAAPDGEGWMLLTQVFRENRTPTAYIAIEQGTYLRDQPRGAVQQALSMRTPMMRILETQEKGGRTWAKVEVLDGTVGWVAEDLLSADRPVEEQE